MHALLPSVLLGLAMATTSFGAAEKSDSGGTAQVHLQNQKNEPVGIATLRDTPNGVLVTADLHGLPQGERGFHVHQTGKCVPPFESAGGHFNPTGTPHGFEVPKGPHAGDMPNLFVPESGNVKVAVLLDGVTLTSGKNALLDADGAALVVHGGPDDYSTDPAGGAGDRIACGVIERPAQAAQGASPSQAQR